MRLQEVTLREVELSPSRVLRVFEHTELADCAGALRQLKARAHAVAVTALLTALLTRCGAGAVVWDAALVLVHYLAKVRALCPALQLAFWEEIGGSGSHSASSMCAAAGAYCTHYTDMLSDGCSWQASTACCGANGCWTSAPGPASRGWQQRCSGPPRCF